MKVGRISIITAFLLMLPLAAFAGPPLCEGQGGDADADLICDDVDNCPGISNNDQLDGDHDGRGNVCDNCLLWANGPLLYEATSPVGGPGLSPVSQCDRDSDGYGNACDADLNANFFSEIGDDVPYLIAIPHFFTAHGSPPLGNVFDSAADMNCNGFVEIGDNDWYLDGKAFHFFTGPTGRSCAGVVTGACPPIP